MKKKIIISIIVCLICASTLLIIKTVSKIGIKKQIDENVSILPSLLIETTNHNNFKLDSISDVKPLVLITFNTSCDICQNEIINITDNISAFSKIIIVMISSESMDSIVKFERKFTLNKYSNIYVGQVNDIYINQVLGIETNPQIFIYNSDKKLLKVYKGETKLDTILKYLD